MTSIVTIEQGLQPEKDSRKVLVRVEGVSKKFYRSLKKSLWYGVQDMECRIWSAGYCVGVDGAEWLKNRILVVNG